MEMFKEEYDNAEKCSLSQKSANMPNGEIVSKKKRGWSHEMSKTQYWRGDERCTLESTVIFKYCR